MKCNRQRFAAKIFERNFFAVLIRQTKIRDFFADLREIRIDRWRGIIRIRSGDDSDFFQIKRRRGSIINDEFAANFRTGR